MSQQQEAQGIQADLNQQNDRNNKFFEDEGESQIKQYWQNCNSDCRMIALITNCINCVFQITVIVNPMKESDQFVVNLIYSLASVVIFLFIGLSFKKKYDVKFCYFGVILLNIRQSLRCLDFENTKE